MPIHFYNVKNERNHLLVVESINLLSLFVCSINFPDRKAWIPKTIKKLPISRDAIRKISKLKNKTHKIALILNELLSDFDSINVFIDV